ncbi:hypothetical protein ABMA28_012515 [Loxostege sticticalis]|uniref:Uncharacterized protein n=1 Tax=Loxostege sticticalis TaxID=481309 RepID=A0ABD0S6C5_LOXSC
MADELKRLVAARGNRKATITRMYNYIYAPGEKEPAVLKQKRDSLIKVFAEYTELNIDISLLDTTEENVEEVEEKYFDIMAYFSKYIDGDGGPSSSSQESSFHLPRIQIKSFNGQVGDYQSFISLFISVIGKDKKLNDCEKLYYLKTYLEGEALDLIKHLPLTATSYVNALNLLKQRYDNKKQVINHHINLLLDMPGMTKTTAVGLRNLVSLTKQHIGALQSLGAPTEHWSLIVIAILQRKIDQYTLRAFHIEKQSNDDLPKLDDFLLFLEQRASALEAIGGGTGDSSNRRSSLVLLMFVHFWIQEAKFHLC